MKILHVVHQYLPEHVGGTELYTQQLARLQAEQGDEVMIFVPTAHQSSDTMEDGVRVIRVGVGQRGRGRIFFDTFGNRPLESAFSLVLDGVDIVHLQHLMGLPVGLVNEINARNIPYVITLHDYWYPCANAQLITNYDETICDGPDAKHHNCGRCFFARGGLGDRPILSSLIAPVLRRRKSALYPILKGAAAVIPPTQFVQDVYATQNIPTDNFHLIRHGIKLPAENPPPPIPHDGFHVVFVGSIAWQKGVHVLIDAFNQMPTQNCRLSIAGGLDSFPDYAEQLQKQVTHPQIEFLGRVPHEEIWALLASADCVVMPTLWYEASPLTIDEFFFAGVPILASNIGAMTEKIRHGIDGILFPAGSSDALFRELLHLFEHPNDLKSYREAILPVRTIEIHSKEVNLLYKTKI